MTGTITLTSPTRRPDAFSWLKTHNPQLATGSDPPSAQINDEQLKVKTACNRLERKKARPPPAPFFRGFQTVSRKGLPRSPTHAQPEPAAELPSRHVAGHQLATFAATKRRLWPALAS